MRSTALRILAGVALAIPMIIVPATGVSAESSLTGGGYAASGQLDNAGYMAQLYDATNGLPTSDANCVLATSDGYIYIGGYSGILRYDGSVFERLDGVHLSIISKSTLVMPAFTYSSLSH